MKFKKLLFWGLLFSAFSLGHLRSEAQVQIGVRGGLNLANIIQKRGDGSNSFGNGLKFRPRFHVGATIDIPIADALYVQPAALFSTKGFIVVSSEAGTSLDRERTPYYVEVPVNFIYKPELGNGHLLLGAGPYAAYGLGGKWKTTTTITGGNPVTTNGPLEFVNDTNEASGGDKLIYGKHFDYGVNVLLGYAFSKRLSAQLNGQLGLANITPNENGQKPEEKRTNVGFGISVGCVL